MIEDESATIGKMVLPKILTQKMKTAPIFELVVPQEERISTIIDDYVVQAWSHFQSNDHPQLDFFNHFHQALLRIKRRLGGLLYQEVCALLKRAIEDQLDSGDVKADFSGHQDWISKILLEYYDPAYRRSITDRRASIIGAGDARELRNLLKSEMA